jgi:hypothetical protein
MISTFLSVCISGLLFADDLVVVARSADGLFIGEEGV